MVKGRRVIFFCLLAAMVEQSCYRNDIQFGDTPENNYTRIVLVDTVSPVLSTVLTDSFPTSTAQAFLFGKYADPYLGVVSTKPFFQMDIPNPAPAIPVTAVYDSAAFLLRLNNYYYGDTSRPQTIHISQLSQQIDYSYNNHLYNTSNFSTFFQDIATATRRIRPAVDSVITVRVNDATGKVLFDKLASDALEVARQDAFIDYFKGVSISVGGGDTTAVYGLDGAAGKQILRIYYHTTIPGLENKTVDFTSDANSFAFNQILTNRANTALYSTTGQKEFPAFQTHDLSYTQYGTGVLAKITFPGLKGIIKSTSIVRLKKAELIIRPLERSFDPFRFKLPPNLFLAQTDGSNTIGSAVLDAASAQVQTISPEVDEIYGLNTAYSFDVTTPLNAILTGSGTEDHGFFVLQNISGLAPKVDRAVLADAYNKSYRTELQLTVIIIDQ